MAGSGIILVSLLSGLALSCKPSGTGDTDTDTDTGSATETGMTSETTAGTGGTNTGGDPIAINRDVDVLFVIDNSASMGEEQATLAANFAAFVGVLEQSHVRADYRIAVTTTDNGHPRCTPDFHGAPDQGKFVLESCRGRIGEGADPNDFFWEPEGIDASYACTDVCDPAVHDALQQGSSRRRS